MPRAGPGRVQRPWPFPDEVDALAVPALQQAPCRRAAALDLVGHDGRARERVGEAVQQHDRLPVEDGRDRHGPGGHRAVHEAGHLPADHAAQKVVLGPAVPVGLRDDQQVVVRQRGR
jgi:hypothetical protein